MAVSVNLLDKKTVNMLDNGIVACEKKLKPDYIEEHDLDKSTINKLNSELKKFKLQKGKTVNLFNKHKKKSQLKGLSVSTMSVEKIYQALGKTTKDNALGAWIRESPGRIVNVAGAGLAVGGTIKTLAGKGVFDGLGEAFKNFFTNLSGANPAVITGVSILGAGALALIVGHTMTSIQKNKFKNAALRQDIEKEMNENTVKDFDALQKADDEDKRKSLAEQASVDPNLMQHLQDVIANPRTSPTIAKNAQFILAKAQEFQVENNERTIGLALNSNIMAAAGGTKIRGVGKKDDVLKRFAVQQEVKRLLKEQDAPIAADPAPGELTDSDAITAYSTFIEDLKKTDKITPDDIKKISSEDEFVRYLSNHAKFKDNYSKIIKNGTDTTVEKIQNHIDGIIKNRYRQVKASEKISKLAENKVIIAEAKTDGTYDSDKISFEYIDKDEKKDEDKIKTKSYKDVEKEGMETLVVIAEKYGIKLSGSSTEAKYASLCSKYDGPTGVKAAIASIQRDGFNLEGMEK